MILTCSATGCYSAPINLSNFCKTHHNEVLIPPAEQERLINQAKMKEIMASVKPPPLPEPRLGRRNSDKREGENSGGDVDYYRVHIPHPKRTVPHTAECEDIIEALNMTFAEGCAFKAIWRKAAQRTLGHMKRGADQHGVRDSEKVEYYGKRMLVQAQRAASNDTADDVRAAAVANLANQK